MKTFLLVLLTSITLIGLTACGNDPDSPNVVPVIDCVKEEAINNRIYQKFEEENLKRSKGQFNEASLYEDSLCIRCKHLRTFPKGSKCAEILLDITNTPSSRRLCTDDCL